jgi:tRNA threonylcarbamoyl adenosine modification protein (Sua5/YciO/YrdC/YwlC family)
MAVGLASAVAALAAGEIVGVPTDTVYGIGADPFVEAAVASLFSAKARRSVKPIPILVADTVQAGRIGRLDGAARRLADLHWPGPLTLVVPRVAGLPGWIGDPGRDSVGIRVPDHPVALALLSAAGPLAVTSANPTGHPPVSDHTGARAALGDAVAIYLEGAGSGGEASTVLDVTGTEPRVLRPGPVRFGPA